MAELTGSNNTFFINTSSVTWFNGSTGSSSSCTTTHLPMYTTPPYTTTVPSINVMGSYRTIFLDDHYPELEVIPPLVIQEETEAGDLLGP